MNLKWLNGFAPMYEKPDPNGRKVRDLLEKSLVMTRDEVVLWNGHPFVEVEYIDTKVWRGWVYAGYLEDYVENLPKDCVDLGEQTPAPNDAEQYVHYNGTKQVNLCGEICAAFCAGVGLTYLLTEWQKKYPKEWTRVFKKPGAVADGTGVGDLVTMLETVGIKAYSLTQAMHDPYLKRSRYTVEWLKRMLTTGHVIASVTINRSGRLDKTGALHWVVVTSVMPERCGYGLVSVFNPFPNRVETYTWSEWMTAAKHPAGVYAPKETQ